MAALAGIALLVLLFFWRLSFTDLILPRGDAFTYFYPYWDYKHEVLRSGHLPLWNPYLFMGVPFLANSQAGVLYPFNQVLTPFDAPTAVKISLIGHATWGATGLYIYGRRKLRLSPLPALLAGTAFTLGGYWGAQVEHVNQVQGMSWIPWLFWLWEESLDGKPKHLLWLALAFGMQLLAGHTQSAFISGVGLGIRAVWETGTRWFADYRRQPSGLLLPIGELGAASLVALGLAAAQILPTLELTSLSNRQGGLSTLEAVSFSLNPLLMGRSVLPDFSGGERLFSEYVAYVGVTILVLAIIGAWYRTRASNGLLVTAAAGLFLGLGAYNPVYWFLVNLVPGFNLFRAPARWLILLSFALAGLAGIGLQRLIEKQNEVKLSQLATAGGGVVGLALLAFLSPVQSEPGIGAGTTTLVDVGMWLLLLCGTLGAIYLTTHVILPTPIMVPVLASLALVELFIASASQPYNNLSVPAAWTSQRPAISTLIASETGEPVPSRFLSISETFFDPGDLREIEAIYGPHLTDEELENYVIATKQKEILTPNLPLAWGIPSIDGFDGGVLPPKAYIDYTSQFLPGDVEATDGRLREYLTGVPENRWLAETNTRYIITDKVFDAWVDGIYYDLQLPTTLDSSNPFASALPWLPFEANAIGLIGHTDAQVGEMIGEIEVVMEDGRSERFQLEGGGGLDPSHTEYMPLRFSWDTPSNVARVEIHVELDTSLELRGITLIDERSGAFQPTSLRENITLIHSADVKIYEYSEVWPRAFVTCELEAISPCEAGQAELEEYTAEQVTINVDSEKNAWLVLTDAYYPGWEATVDGQRASILPVNGMFRAVAIPAGASNVVFTYRSVPLQRGMIISLLTLVLVTGALAVRWPN